MHRLARVFAAFAILGALSFSPALAENSGLVVFAAASMKNALDDVNAAYTKKSGVKVAASYAASSTLAKQIEQGAPADVFLSADIDWMDYVATEEGSSTSATRVNLLGNSIVLIAPKDAEIDQVTIGQGFDLAKLAGDGKIATGDVDSGAGRQICQVGAGEAGRLGRRRRRNSRWPRASAPRWPWWRATKPCSGSSIRPTPRSNRASRSSALSRTDSHPAIIYPVAATVTAKPAAAGYLGFLRTSAAKAIFEKYGFKFLVSPTT